MLIYLTKKHKFSIILKPVSKRHQNKVFENWTEQVEQDKKLY